MSDNNTNRNHLNNLNNVLNLDDLFDQIQTAEMNDFPEPGQSRIVRFKKMSGKDELKRWKLFAKLNKLKAQKEDNNTDEEALINAIDEVYSLSSDLISRYLVGNDNKPLITAEQAYNLPLSTITALNNAMADKGKELGEDSAPMEMKESSSDGSIGAQTSVESSTSSN